MLASYVVNDLVKEYKQTKREMDSIDAEQRVRDLLRGVYDDHVWQIVDEQGESFDDVMYDIVDEVVALAEDF